MNRDALANRARHGDPQSTADRGQHTRRVVALSSVALLTLVAVSSAPFPSVCLLLFTPAAVVAGWLCMLWWPSLYMQLCLWTVFLAPLIRRMVDFHLGYRAANPILLAPLLVPGLSIVHLCRKGATLGHRLNVPYLLAIAGVGYGFVIGVMKLGVVPAGYGMLTWLVPITLAFYATSHWREYARDSRAIAWTFTLALLVLGLYGIAQFVQPFPWDTYWIIAGGQSVAIDPRPLHVRIFGTLNSFGPFAAVLLSGLMQTLSSPLPFVLRLVAALAGLAALLLSQVRTSWAALAFGTVLLIVASRGMARLRFLVLAVLAGCLVPLLLLTPAGDLLRLRFGSILQFRDDGSYIERQTSLTVAWRAIGQTPEGAGTGATGMAWVLGGDQSLLIEQGFQDVLYSLGWAGGALYLLGLVAMAARAVIGGEARRDLVGRACRVGALALLITALFGDVFVAATGLLLWLFLGLHSAARQRALAEGVPTQSWLHVAGAKPSQSPRRMF